MATDLDDSIAFDAAWAANDDEVCECCEVERMAPPRQCVDCGGMFCARCMPDHICLPPAEGGRGDGA